MLFINMLYVFVELCIMFKPGKADERVGGKKRGVVGMAMSTDQLIVVVRVGGNVFWGER